MTVLTAPISTVDVAIIGAGFSGLAAAVRLQERGNPSFIVFERAAAVGGTWRDNTYPGCGCDVRSHLYSFSFNPNPGWSRVYSKQPEIQQYLVETVSKFGLAPHIRYNTEIIRTEFSEETGRWTLTDRAGQQTTARAVIGATGPLNRPSIPKIKGLETFGGKAFHSSNWDHSCDLTGKRVAVIGTGASAIQIVPEIAPIAGQLTVFQRTPPYITPKPDRPIKAWEKRLFTALPVAQQAKRSLIYWLNELVGTGFLGNKTISKLGTETALKHLESQITAPELRRKLTPNYQLGCKRVLVSNDYYPALTRPNVSLETERIAEVTPTGIVTTDGKMHPTDVLIFGTGFVAADIIADLHIVGREGRVLFDEWAKTGPEAYYGITTSGYPNLFFLVGPNTGLGHNSIIHMIESQMNYIMDCLDVLDTAGPDAFLDVKPDVQQAHNADLQAQLQKTVWASGCQSWYQDSRGKITTIWPALTVTYRKLTKRVNPADYALVRAKKVPAVN